MYNNIVFNNHMDSDSMVIFLSLDKNVSSIRGGGGVLEKSIVRGKRMEPECDNCCWDHEWKETDPDPLKYHCHKTCQHERMCNQILCVQVMPQKSCLKHNRFCSQHKGWITKKDE
jgi:hypothetical protein